MIRSGLALFPCVVLLFASAPAEAGRPRGAQVLDRDAVALMPEEPIWYFTLLRGADGGALLLDQSDATPLRATPLGFTPASGAHEAIAILIGLVVRPTPALFVDCFQGGRSRGGVWAWNGASFEPARFDDGAWSWADAR
ncbi:MAG: hypothetical protein DCC71_14365 [Proteobacteria bacterium]|nr:MAG: hypothetical protein DCC71_14365 [Pseudomonadota bacterium]